MIRQLSRAASLYCAVLVCLLLLLRHGRAQDCEFDAVRITQPLVDMMAPLGSNATFECRGDGDITWRVRGTQITAPGPIRDSFTNAMIFVPIGDDNVSQLVVTATEDNDRLPIACIFNLLSAPTRACTEAEFTVFGIPGAPENLTTREQELDRVELEWDSPQLRMNEVVTYILSATNSDTGDVALNETVVMGTSYTFQRPAGDDLCDAYGFDLFAVNQVGASDAGVSTMSTIPTGPQQFGNITVSVSLLSVTATLQFSSVTTCPQYPVSSYNITLLAEGSTPLKLPLVSAPTGEDGQVTVTLPPPSSPPSSSLMENQRYQVLVVAENQFGGNSPGNVEFFTTDVQSASVGIFPDDNSSTVTCLFAPGTAALGCQVTLTISLESGGTLVSAAFNINRTGSTAVGSVELDMVPTLGNLEAVVVDWEADGSAGSVEIAATVGLLDPTTAPPTTLSPTSQVLPGVPLGNTLYIIIGAIGGFILVVILCVIVIICVLCSNRRRRKQRSVELKTDTEDLKDNYAYGDGTLLQAQNTVLENGANITRNNTYDMPGPRTTAENEKIAANPTYETPMASPLPPKEAGNQNYEYAYARTNSSPGKSGAGPVVSLLPGQQQQQKPQGYSYARTNSSPGKSVGGGGGGGGGASLVPAPHTGGNQTYAYAYAKTTPNSSISTNPPASPSAPLVRNPVYGSRSNVPLPTPITPLYESELPSLKTRPSVASNISLPTSPVAHTTYDVEPPPIYEEISLKRKSKSVEGAANLDLDRNASYGAFSNEDMKRARERAEAGTTITERKPSESQTDEVFINKEQNGTTV